ncbi:hypothetical protein [Novipirellula sp.]|uniref:hypothetical protein n=1 Tax=Novipirellula sp. TaxID=2795430 RepID=UPI003567FA85
MSENVKPVEPVKSKAYWSWRRRIAFAFMQLSAMAYAMGIGAFIAYYIIGNMLGGANREVTIAQAFPLFAVFYLIACLMIAAILTAVIALIFSRSALYLAIPYVPTAVYAYYTLSA